MKNLIKSFAVTALLAGSSSVHADGPDAAGAFLPTMMDACIPNFTHEQWVKAPQHVVESVKAGNWSDASVWSGALDANAVVRVKHNVVFDTDANVWSIGVYPSASLKFSTTKNMTLRVIDLLVHTNGLLEIGNAQQSVDPNVTINVIFRDVAINTTNTAASSYDPGQYGNGLVVFGTIHVKGSPKNTTFVRLTQEPKAGNTNLTIEQAVAGWKVGDRLLLPDSRNLKGETDATNYVPQLEEVTLQSVSASAVTFSPALRFEHPAARNALGTIDFYPHIANLSRNVVFKSENENGVRGHSIFLMQASVDVENASFLGMGRTVEIDHSEDDGTDSATFGANCTPTHIGTNQLGRYSVHAHHLTGPAGLDAITPQFSFVGNTLDGGDSALTQSRRWGMTIHGSHYGLVKDNVIYRAAGAGVVTEDGSESFNHIEHNFVARITGGGNRNNKGNDGSAFWFRGPNNYVNDNVATNINPDGIYSYGYTVASTYLGTISIPKFKGAMPHAGEGQDVDGNSIPLLQFERNEIYGATPDGMTVWWLGTFGEEPRGTAGTIKDMRVWHCHKWAFFGYPTTFLTLDHYTVRCDKRVTGSSPYDLTTGLFFADYDSKKTTILNPDIQGCSNGITAPIFSAVRGPTQGVTTINGGYLDNKGNIGAAPPSSVNGSDSLPPIRLVVQNVQFGTQMGNDDIGMSDNLGAGYGTPNLRVTNDLLIYNYNKPVGQTGGPDLYLIPTYKAASACDNTIADCSADVANLYPRINGSRVYRLRSTTTGPDTTPPATPQALVGVSGNGSATLTWTANSDVDLAGYNVYRSATQNGSYVKQNTVLLTVHTYTQTGLVNGTVYWYKVSAVDRTSPANESAQSAAVSVTPAIPVDVTAPAVPRGLSAVQGDTRATLSWNANNESDLAGYNIYRSATQNGTYTKQNTTGYLTSPTFAQTGLVNNTIYWYKVSAVDLTVPANESAQSAAVSVTPSAAIDTTPPSAPTGLGAIASDGSITLVWTANTESDLAGYAVYRSATQSGTYTKQTGNTLLTAPTYTQAGLVNDTVYWYKITAVDRTVPANESAKSAAVSVTPVTGAPPVDITAPIVSQITVDTSVLGSAIFNWHTNEDADSQVDYGTTLSYGGTSLLDSSLAMSHTVLVNGLLPSTLYHYRVRSQDASKNPAASPDATFVTPSVGSAVAAPGGENKLHDIIANVVLGSMTAPFPNASVDIYDRDGHRVKAFQGPGSITDIVNLGAGTYLCRAQFSNGSSGKLKLVVLK